VFDIYNSDDDFLREDISSQKEMKCKSED